MTNDPKRTQNHFHGTLKFTFSKLKDMLEKAQNEKMLKFFSLLTIYRDKISH
jgi:hypothetical protein